MDIRGFRVRKYRNIEDSGKIDLLDNLTCVVGKNQSGKTSLLRALHKFNPHQPNPYDMRREWPRGQRTQQNAKQVVCEVWFELNSNEKDRLSQLTEQQMTASRVVVSKDYAGNFEIQFPDVPDLFPDRLHPNDVDSACLALPEPAAEAGSQFIDLAGQCLEETRRYAKEGRFTDLSELRARHVAQLRLNFTPENPEPQHSTEESYVQIYEQKLQEVESKLKSGLSMHQQAHDYIVSLIPTFIYMDDYKRFRGRANLSAVKEKERNGDLGLSEEDETFLMILRLADLDLDQLIEQGGSADQEVIHDRQLDLEDAATTLTNQVAGRWGQNAYRVQFRADGLGSC